VKSTAEIVLAPAQAEDAAEIAALLRAAGLPSDDFAPHLGRFLVARDGATVIGTVGAEVNGSDALLRSLAVAESRRGAGLGTRLLAALEDAAAGWGVERWWLLTTTAETFFAAHGFRVAARTEAPEAIRRTGQFNGGCCRSAVCMTRERKGAA
jgi:amino-acid N-acetyltransferase